MNYNNWLKKRERYTPDKAAIVDAVKGNKYSYRQLNQLSNQLAGVLQQTFKLEEGDRLTVVSKNSVEYIILFFACAKIGIILVPLNYRLKADMIMKLIADSDPALLVLSQKFKSVKKKLKKEFETKY